MTTMLKEVMRNTLDNFTTADFKRFRHYVRDQGQIPWGRLEKADTDDAVDLMVQMYSTNAGNVMLTILQKMNHNQLAAELERHLGSLGAQQCSPPWQGAGGSGGVHMSVSAHSGGMVNAPALSGCTIGGPVNFSFGGVPMAQQGGASSYGYGPGQFGTRTGGHDFFQKHKAALELRLGGLAPLLIDLERYGVISSLEREVVQSKSTSHEKNHTLIVMLDRKGARAQERFYEALKTYDPYLVEDLQH